MRAARLVVGASLLLAPVAHAWLHLAAGHRAWPTVAGLVLGLAVGRWAGAGAVVAASLLIAPIWPAIGGTLWPSPAPFDPLWPWLAFLAGGLAWPRDAAWHSSGPWRLAVAGWAMVVAVTWPVVAARELDFTTLSIGAATVNGASGGSPVDTASFVMLTASAQLAALLLFEWHAGQSSDARALVWRWPVPGVVAAVAVAVWQQVVDPSFLSAPPWNSLQRAAGTFFDANATGALLALAGPAVAAQLVRTSGTRANASLRLAVTLLVACLAGILATGSRTALAGFLASALLVLAASTRVRVWVGLAVLVAVLGAVVISPPSESARGNAASRLVATLRNVGDGGIGEAWTYLRDRDGYGIAARAAIADHPWFGVGSGAFAGLAGDYGRAQWGPLPPDNAQNWWRQQVAELGAVGSAPSLLASLLVMGAALRALWRRKQLAAVAPLAGLGVMALVSPPTAHPVIQIVVALVVAAGVAVGSRVDARPAMSWHSAAVWLLAVTCAIGTAVDGWRELRPPYRASRFHFIYSYGISDIVTTPFGEGRWMKPRAVGVILPTGGRTLVVRVVAPHDDAAQRPVRIVVSNRAGPVCTHDAVDPTPFECRVPVPHDVWPFVRVDVDRVWRHDAGFPRAAVVSARFED